MIKKIQLEKVLKERSGGAIPIDKYAPKLVDIIDDVINDLFMNYDYDNLDEFLNDIIDYCQNAKSSIEEMKEEMKEER
jgi:hypothetical protein